MGFFDTLARVISVIHARVLSATHAWVFFEGDNMGLLKK